MMAKIAQDRSREPNRIKMRSQVGQESAKRANIELQEAPKMGTQLQIPEAREEVGDPYLPSSDSPPL
eukprot:4992059-Karenia_brevis.AAC.1